MRSSYRALVLAVVAGSSLTSVASAQVARDSCSAAESIVLGPTYSGTTVGATLDGSANCGSSASTADVWYKYTPAAAQVGQTVRFELCGSGYDTVLSIHSGCPGTSANQIICNDDACSLQSRVEFVAANTTYMIRVSGFSGATGAFTLTGLVPPPPPPLASGADVIVGDVYDVQNYTWTTGAGTPPGPLNGIYAFAIGTDSCNLGDVPASWVQTTNLHPVIAQSMFRLNNNRLEQIGISWLKHGFLSTNQNYCGTCITPPAGGAALGLMCSDIYDSGLNGSQSNGPRSQVNSTTGVFPYPPTGGSGSGRTYKRIQIPAAELQAGSRYFCDTQYVTQDDAQWDNGTNNVSYREITASTLTNQFPTFASTSRVNKTGLWAWKDYDPSNVNVATADLLVSSPKTVTVPAGHLPLPDNIRARFEVASRATSLGGGLWQYEYAVYNINCDRAAGTFSVALPPGAVITSPGFHAPLYHSGEPYSNAVWTSTVAGGNITFACDTYATNVNANALRWGTMYNFRFVCNAAPNAAGSATLGLFKPGTGSSLTVTGIHTPTIPPTCLADIVSTGGLPPPDGFLTGDDFVAFTNGFANGDLICDIVSTGGLPPPDGFVTGDDFIAFINSFANGCP